MSWDQILTGFIYLAVVLVLVSIGRWAYDALHRGFVLRTELVERDNLAMALAIAGYYLGLAIVLGEVVSGPGSGVLTDDVIDLVIVVILLRPPFWASDSHHEWTNLKGVTPGFIVRYHYELDAI